MRDVTVRINELERDIARRTAALAPNEQSGPGMVGPILTITGSVGQVGLAFNVTNQNPLYPSHRFRQPSSCPALIPGIGNARPDRSTDARCGQPSPGVEVRWQLTRPERRLAGADHVRF